MREQLLKILVFLRETSSRDLAEELAKGVYKKDKIEKRILSSIIGFLEIEIKKGKLGEKTKNLIKASNLMKKVRDIEGQERKEEEKELEDELDSLLNL